MNLLFIGPFCPAEKQDYIKTISSYFDYPANVLESALINGFDSLSSVGIVSSLRLVTRKFFVPEYRFYHSASSKFEDVVLSFYNIPYCDKLLNDKRKFKEVKNQDFRPDIIFVYSSRLEDIKAARLLKRKYPKAVALVMITDLAQFMRDSPGFVYRILKAYEKNLCDKCMKESIDGYVLLSEHMKEHLPIENKPYIVVEGIFHPEEYTISVSKKANEKVIMYSGNLDSRYGLLDLLYAFKMIEDDNYRLWICGVGNTDNDFKEASIKDSRVVYMGALHRSKVLELQKQATLLVNPRHSNENYTKYSFPSKTMEFMASGTPTLMSPLMSLPAEYKEHVYLFDDESASGMARAMQNICNKPKEELNRFGCNASEFILKNKTANIQCKRIVDFALSLK